MKNKKTEEVLVFAIGISKKMLKEAQKKVKTRKELEDVVLSILRRAVTEYDFKEFKA